MTYTVVLTELAQEQIDEAYAWLVARTPMYAPEWHAGLLQAIASLEEFPLRCPIIPEPEGEQLGIQYLLCGSKRHAYRIIFSIDGATINVLQVRHAARGGLR